MKLQEMTLQQLKEILDGAPEGANSATDTQAGIQYCIWSIDKITQKWDEAWGWHNAPEFYRWPFIKLSDLRARIAELEPKQKYDWSNVPDVVNWLATDKDGECAWGFLEEPVIELEDGEWRPVAPYTEIYINGSNGTVAAYKGDWQESLEQRKFKIGDKVTFIRNIEPFQWGAKEKVYEVVDVADNLPTSTDQRVWLDTTASSPHLSRNLCLATAIGQLGIEDLPVHGEPICSEIITNSPEFDGIKTQLDNEAVLFNELPIDAELEVPASASQHPHYFKDVSGLTHIDVYQVLRLYEVTDPCLQHIVKKALCAGKRGSKDFVKDVQEIADTANRLVEIEGEQGE